MTLNTHANDDPLQRSRPTDDSPEELIRSLTKAVNCTRGLAVTFLAVATIFFGFATYKVLSKLEHNAFEASFKDLGTRLTHAFLDELGSKMWSAYSLSIGVTGMNTLDSSIPNFPQRFSATIGTESPIRAVYSPLLRGYKERLEWESFARTTLHTDANIATTDNICYVCGDQSTTVEFPEKLLQLWNSPTLSCRDVENWGLIGQIPPGLCEKTHMVVAEQCSCVATNAQPASASNNSLPADSMYNNSQRSDRIYRLQNGSAVTAGSFAMYSPIWQIAISAPPTALLYDQMSDPVRRSGILSVARQKIAAFTKTKFEPGEYESVVRFSLRKGPLFTVFYPIFDSIVQGEIIGTIALDFEWIFVFSNTLPFGSDGILLVIENSQDQIFTVQVQNNQLTFIGQGDYHDRAFDYMEQHSDFKDLDALRLVITPDAYSTANLTADQSCSYRIRVYPTEDFKRRYVTNKPVLFTTVVVLIFVLTSAVFFFYDVLVRRRQTKILRSARVNSTIVSSLFPANIRGRLMENSEESGAQIGNDRQRRRPSTLTSSRNPRLQLTNYLAKPAGDPTMEVADSEPIADLFPNTTVFFADIAGFTAWSSEREPSQVFKLLETIFGAFDAIASKLGVFKVETVGDCYVAVTGLPNPQDDHVVIMAKFARECVRRMQTLTKQLESILGSSTGNLALRVGLHSGPVTAGVLRGTMARFQLFGDTMNTASRMESNGKVNKVQVSQATADLLTEAGKSKWIHPRSDLIEAKGKGKMQTYWLSMEECSEEISTFLSVRTSDTDIHDISLDSGAETSVDQLTHLLRVYLQRVVAHRQKKNSICPSLQSQEFADKSTLQAAKYNIQPRQELVDSIAMSESDACTLCNHGHSHCVSKRAPNYVELAQLSHTALEQLRHFIGRIATLYDGNSNAFHNLEHASHVAMSTAKLLQHVKAPEVVKCQQVAKATRRRNHARANELHDTTYGIIFDPLIQFAAIFAALIHDVDHQGVPNSRLSEEMSPIAVQYQHKSPAEQHSVQVAWQMLMEEQYQDFRAYIFDSDKEMLRFRQMVINAVMATDIHDPDLRCWRENRWKQAFAATTIANGTTAEDNDSNTAGASIVVLEYILQASDVAHTMQHWHTYRKWNQRLFDEMYHAYRQGRAKHDPSTSWYDDELRFFDNYIIPLAHKLHDCGIFGVSSEEYLLHAMENRHEWEQQGKDIVMEMIQQVKFVS